MFWGDRFCKFADPFGHIWCVATHKEDVSLKRIATPGDLTVNVFMQSGSEHEHTASRHPRVEILLKSDLAKRLPAILGGRRPG